MQPRDTKAHEATKKKGGCLLRIPVHGLRTREVISDTIVCCIAVHRPSGGGTTRAHYAKAVCLE